MRIPIVHIILSSFPLLGVVSWLCISHIMPAWVTADMTECIAQKSNVNIAWTSFPVCTSASPFTDWETSVLQECLERVRSISACYVDAKTECLPWAPGPPESLCCLVITAHVVSGEVHGEREACSVSSRLLECLKGVLVSTLDHNLNRACCWSLSVKARW